MPAELEIDGNSGRRSQARQRRVAEIAARQHGVIARWQLVELDWSHDAIDHRVRRGALHVVHHAVYAVGHARLSRKGRWMAAVLSCGPAGVLSHRSAAALWGICRPPHSQPEVIIDRDRPRRPGVTVRRATLARADRSVIDGIPVTSLPRTFLDLAAVAPWVVEPALEEAERLELFDLRAVEELIRRSNGRRGVARLRAALSHYREPAFMRSEMERRFLGLVRKAGLPRPSTNWVVLGHEVDVLWPEEQLVVELDGYEFHRTRRAHELDRRRDDDLGLAGFRVIRLTWSRLAEPGLAARLAAHLDRRRRELGLT